MLIKDSPKVAEEWLTPAQAAHLLDVTPAMIRYWANRGQVDCQRTPLGRLIGAESVERLRHLRSAVPEAAAAEVES